MILQNVMESSSIVCVFKNNDKLIMIVYKNIKNNDGLSNNNVTMST